MTGPSVSMDSLRSGDFVFLGEVTPSSILSTRMIQKPTADPMLKGKTGITDTFYDSLIQVRVIQVLNVPQGSAQSENGLPSVDSVLKSSYLSSSALEAGTYVFGGTLQDDGIFLVRSLFLEREVETVKEHLRSHLVQAQINK